MGTARLARLGVSDKVAYGVPALNELLLPGLPD
jgi:hypothetical protein